MDTIAALRLELAEISRQLVESQTREAQLLAEAQTRTDKEVSLNVVTKTELTRDTSVLSGDEVSPGSALGIVGDPENYNRYPL